ncbi:MAG: WecB/TagA/CpsF family glycosyltransferase [Lachnospiraceae bacterium]|nr:WecB/TagA/CpsF family glycosyltransferase [Lachnospiraceae bacterium]
MLATVWLRGENPAGGMAERGPNRRKVMRGIRMPDESALTDISQVSIVYRRKINKSEIPVCKILGVDIAAIDMNWLIEFTEKSLDKLRSDYFCVVNVYSDVTAYNDPEFCRVLNSAALCMPDGGPLSVVGSRRGHKKMQRTTGPDYMSEIFRRSAEHKWRHYFFGSTDETLIKLQKKLLEAYPDLEIAGMYSPPFHSMTVEEDQYMVQKINESKPDFLWVGLSCPKQEKWMYEHLGKVNGLMCGVGAGFDYHAGNILRAPEWMQAHNLEWVYRLIQEPKRLFKKYWHTNLKFIWLAMARGK